MTAFLEALGSSGVTDALGAAATAGSGIQGLITGNRNAKALRSAGDAAERDSLAESARLLGSQRAAYAKAGVEFAGTPMDVLAATAEQEAMDALRIRYGYRSAADTQRREGTVAFTGGVLEGVTKARVAYDKRRTLLPEMRYRLPRKGEKVGGPAILRRD